MEAVSYTAFRKDMRTYLDRARDDAAPIMVTSKDPSANAVVINARDYDNLMENVYVQTNPYLVAKLERGRHQYEEGLAQARELSDDGE